MGILVHALHNQAGCEAVAAELERAGAKAAVMLGDLVKPETGRLLVERAVEAFGGLDVLVANAGFPDRRQIGSLDRAGLDYCFAVITGGFFGMLTAAEKHLKGGTDPRVIAISTHNAHVFRTDYPNYPASGRRQGGPGGDGAGRIRPLRGGRNHRQRRRAGPDPRKQAGTEQFLSAQE